MEAETDASTVEVDRDSPMEGIDRRSLVSAGLIAGILTAIVGLFVLATYPKISPVDELQHIDSALKAGAGRWVLPPNDLIGLEAMRAEACRGIDAGFLPPPCASATLLPEWFQENGINTSADGLPSPYYIATGTLGRVVQVAGVTEVTGLRVVSLGAHVLGAALAAVLCTAVSRSVRIGAALGTATGALGPVLAQSVTVNPDAWALLGGGCFTAVAVFSDRLSARAILLWTAGFGLVFTAVKPNWFLLALIPLVFVGVRWWQAGRSGTWSRKVAAAAGAFAFSAIVMVGLSIGSMLIPSVGPSAPMGSALAITDGNPFIWMTVITQSMDALVVTRQPGVVDVLEGPLVGSVAVLWGVALLGFTLAGVLAARTDTDLFPLALGSITCLVFTPLFVFIGQYASNVFFSYPTRYSFCCIPVMAVAMAATSGMRSRVLLALALVSWCVPMFYAARSI